jgi:hypothetical protein
MNLSELITAARAGLESLRIRGLVEPQCLLLMLEGERLRWQYFKFCALPGHPKPGNASKRMPPANMSREKEDEWRRNQSSMYSHPVEVACFRQSEGRIANPLVGLTSQKDAVSVATEISRVLFGEESTEVEIARRIGPGEMGVTAYELPAGRLVRHGDDDADAFPLSELVILRHGRTCWEEYPKAGTVDVQPDFEGKLGFVVDEDERRRLDDLSI